MAYSQLTYGDRIHIAVLLQEGKAPSEAATLIGRDRSTIYREISRNKAANGYSAETAHKLSEDRKAEAAAIPRIDEDIENWVIEKLRLQWSPEQISKRMEIELGETVSHEWIYQLIYEDRKKGGDLHTNLRWGRKTRKKRGGGRDKRGQIPNRVSIEQRPEIIDERGRIGDFEGDTVIGANHQGVLLTLVDRTSRLAIIEKLENKSADLTEKAIVSSVKAMDSPVTSITFDNGKEFSNHENISKETDVPIYFAHPYSSYERGTNENTNGLIRQYFPKKTALSQVTSRAVKSVEGLINHRPRKVLGFKTPYEVHYNQNFIYFARP